MRILVTYASLAGSTGEVARVVGEDLAEQGAQVDLIPVAEVKDLAGYDAVVLGAPMIMGWHRAALGFLRRHRAALKQKPIAIFVMAMSLTQTGDQAVDGVPILVDDALAKAPKTGGQLTLRERYAQVRHYVRPIVRAARPAQPVTIGVFGGRLEYGRLPWWAVIFVTLVIQAPAGDHRNWTAIHAWAAKLPTALRQ